MVGSDHPNINVISLKQNPVAMLVGSLVRIVAPVQELWKLIELQQEAMRNSSFALSANLFHVKLLNPHQVHLNKVMSEPSLSSQAVDDQMVYISNLWKLHNKLRLGGINEQRIVQYAVGIMRLLFGMETENKIWAMTGWLNLDVSRFYKKVMEEMKAKEADFASDMNKFSEKFNNLIGSAPLIELNEVAKFKRNLQSAFPAWLLKETGVTFILSADSNPHIMGDIIEIADPDIFRNITQKISSEITDVSGQQYFVRHFRPYEYFCNKDLGYFPQFAQWRKKSYGWEDAISKLYKMLIISYPQLKDRPGLQHIPAIECHYSPGDFSFFIQREDVYNRIKSNITEGVFKIPLGPIAVPYQLKVGLRVPEMKMFTVGSLMPRNILVLHDLAKDGQSFAKQLEGYFYLRASKNCNASNPVLDEYFKNGFKLFVDNQQRFNDDEKNTFSAYYKLDCRIFFLYFILSFINQLICNLNKRENKLFNAIFTFKTFIEIIVIVGFVVFFPLKTMTPLGIHYGLSCFISDNKTNQKLLNMFVMASSQILLSYMDSDVNSTSAMIIFKSMCLCIDSTIGQFFGKSLANFLVKKPKNRYAKPRAKEHTTPSIQQAVFYIISSALLIIYTYFHIILQIIRKIPHYIGSLPLFYKKNQVAFTIGKKNTDLADEIIKNTHLLDKTKTNGAPEIKSNESALEVRKNTIFRKWSASEFNPDHLELDEYPFDKPIQINIHPGIGKGLENISRVFDILQDKGLDLYITGGAALVLIEIFFKLKDPAVFKNINDLDLCCSNLLILQRELDKHKDLSYEVVPYKFWDVNKGFYIEKNKITLQIAGFSFSIDISEFKQTGEIYDIIQSEVDSCYSSIKRLFVKRNTQGQYLLIFANPRAIQDVFNRHIGLKLSGYKYVAPEWAFMILDMICMGYDMRSPLKNNVLMELSEYYKTKKPSSIKVLHLLMKYTLKHGYKYYALMKDLKINTEGHSYFDLLCPLYSEGSGYEAMSYKSFFNACIQCVKTIKHKKIKKYAKSGKDMAMKIAYDIDTRYFVGLFLALTCPFIVKSLSCFSVNSFYTEFGDLIVFENILSNLSQYIGDQVQLVFSSFGIDFTSEADEPYISIKLLQFCEVARIISELYIECMITAFNSKNGTNISAKPFRKDMSGSASLFMPSKKSACYSLGLQDILYDEIKSCCNHIASCYLSAKKNYDPLKKPFFPPAQVPQPMTEKDGKTSSSGYSSGDEMSSGSV